MIFQHADVSHAEAIKSTPGVQDITWANWFGGIYKDPKNFFGQFAVEPESYLRMYPEIILTPDEKQAFLEDRTGCIVGDGLAKKLRVQGRRQHRRCRSASRPTASQDFDFTIRGIYRAGGAAVDNQSMMFHWKYADERSIAEGPDRLVRHQDRQPRSRDADRRPRSTASSPTRPYETKTDTEQAFSALVRLDVRQPEPAARQRRAGRGASRRCSSPATRWRCRCASGRPKSR